MVPLVKTAGINIQNCVGASYKMVLGNLEDATKVIAVNSSTQQCAWTHFENPNV